MKTAPSITWAEMLLVTAALWATIGIAAGDFAWAEIAAWGCYLSLAIGAALVVFKAMDLVADCAVRAIRPDRDGTAEEDRL